MPQIYSKIYIEESPPTVFKVIANMENFPHFMSGIRSIKHIDTKGVKRISEWSIIVDGTAIAWREEQVINEFMRTIYFRMLEGDYGQYDGQWIVNSYQCGSQVEFRFNIEWDIELDAALSKSLERRARLASRWMLKELRKKIGVGKTLSSTLQESKYKIISEPINILNSQGKKIIGFFDHLEQITTEKPFIVLAPGYGETKRELLSLSYYLAKNNFNVIRYDATEHIGESDGEIYFTTLDKLKEDLLSVIRHICNKHNQRSVGVVAASLSVRVAIKALSESDNISLLLGLVGVVNLQETLKKIYREDIIGDVKSGKVKCAYDVIGFLIDKRFPEEAISSNYHDLETSCDDIKRSKSPIMLFHAEKDQWIDFEDVKSVVRASVHPASAIYLIPGAMHNLMENPKSLISTYKHVVVTAAQYLQHSNVSIEDVIEPMRKEIGLQNRIEKERLRSKAIYTNHTEREFWDTYMGKYEILSKVDDYRRYLELLCALIFKHPHQRFLDAGCGNGYLGASLLSRNNIRNRPLADPRVGYEYIGIDRSSSVVEYARKGNAAILNHHAHMFNGSKPTYKYQICDLNNKLPFDDEYFNQICMSLVLSYLDSPVAALAEIMRVLNRDGQVIISSLKPHADLSEIYTNFVNTTSDERDLSAARALLNETGQIKLKEGTGHYQFYSESDLKTLLLACGARDVQILRSFGNQVNVAAAIKK